MNLRLYIIFLAILLFIFTTSFEIGAETRYVSEEFEITMRTGPAADHKIIALIRSGSAVELLDSGKEWTKVRYNDKVGWVLTRYLSSKEPCALTLTSLQEMHGTVKKENKDLLQKNADLEAENQRLQTALSTHQDSLEQISSEYEKLKLESADFLKLKKAYEKASKELATAKALSEKSEKEIQQLLKDQNIKWFMVGAGVLILGFIIGFSSRRQRRQSSLL
ncbi:MAG: TIGR04211 family SH3 domain-containing protein [Desulfobacteraceae bacterium]|jgi:SH3 domain protein